MNNIINTIVFSNLNGILKENFNLKLYQNFGFNKQLALTLAANSEALGYQFSKELLISLSHATEDDLTAFWKWFKPEAKKSVGAHRTFEPMYPNFPKQVMSTSDFELAFNAISHYIGDWIGFRILPIYQKETRLPLNQEIKLKQLNLVDISDIEDYFVNLMNANSSLSVSDKENINILFKYFKTNNTINDIFKRTNIVQKETLGYIGALIVNNDLDYSLIETQLKTPTDVLRFIVAMFNGDVSLSKPTKIGSLKRSMRRNILNTLEQQLEFSNDGEQLFENMFTYKEQWVKIAHALHSGEYHKQFPMISVAFNDLRENNKPQSFNSKVKQLIDSHKTVEASELLKARPGIFARHLAHLVESTINQNTLKVHDTVMAKKLEPLRNKEKVSEKIINSQISTIINNFKEVSSSVSTPVLLQAHAHFKNQNDLNFRAFMPKGGLGKIYVLNEKVDKLNNNITKKIETICENTLIDRFSKFQSLGNVYIDNTLKLQNIPFAQRSASKALKSVARGSRFDLNQETQGNIVRLFLWWNEKNTKQTIGRVDIDLSCVLMDENYNHLETCSYYNLRDRNGGLTHSGDITSAPNGACEFIDINLDKINQNVRYILMTAHSYTQQKYCDLPECHVGWMVRNSHQKGEIFEPKTVINKIDLTAESGQVMPAIFDVKEKHVIWADMTIKQKSVYYNNAHNNMSALAYNVKAITNMKKPTLFDLFTMHAKARGTIVEDKSKADTIFSLTDGITPYMFDKITSDFMADEAPKNVLKIKP